MNRTKSEQEAPRRGQLGRFRKVSKQAPQVTDFFEWENPMEAGSGHAAKMPVNPRKSQRAPSRRVERRLSAPIYKQTSTADVSAAGTREITFNPPPRLPKRTTSSRIIERKQSYRPPSSPQPEPEDSSAGNQNFENMGIECNEDDGIASIGDLTLYTFEPAEPCYNGDREAFQKHNMQRLQRRSSPERPSMQPPRRRSSPEQIRKNNSYHCAGSELRGSNHGGKVERTRVHNSHHERPLAAFGPRRKVSISRPMAPAPPRPSSSARTLDENEEERMIQLAMELSLHEAEASNHTRMSISRCNNGSEHSEQTFASQTSNNSLLSLSSAGCHLSMIAAQMKNGSPDGCGVQRSNSDGPIDPNFVWRKEGKRWMKIHVDDLNNANDSLHAIQEHDNENNNSSTFVARRPARTTSLNPDLAMRRLRELEQEKRMIEQAMRLSMASPPNIVSDSPISMSEDDEEVVNELQEEELLAEALKRSMQEM